MECYKTVRMAQAHFVEKYCVCVKGWQTRLRLTPGLGAGGERGSLGFDFASLSLSLSVYIYICTYCYF